VSATASATKEGIRACAVFGASSASTHGKDEESIEDGTRCLPGAVAGDFLNYEIAHIALLLE
jgi:hypothetical protein